MATYTTNEITRAVAGDIPAYRLVKSLNDRISLANADSAPFGAVTEAGSDKADSKLPGILRVHTGQAVVPVETDETGFTEGSTVYAAVDGKVSSTGTVAVGLVDAPEHSTRGVQTVRVNLFHTAAK